MHIPEILCPDPAGYIRTECTVINIASDFSEKQTCNNLINI